jgi:hypothetical protein
VWKAQVGEAVSAEYFDRLASLYSGRVPGGADLVAYWFEKAWDQICAGRANRAGLVATQSIRKGSNRQGLDNLLKKMKHILCMVR